MIFLLHWVQLDSKHKSLMLHSTVPIELSDRGLIAGQPSLLPDQHLTTGIDYFQHGSMVRRHLVDLAKL